MRIIIVDFTGKCQLQILYSKNWFSLSMLVILKFSLFRFLDRTSISLRILCAETIFEYQSIILYLLDKQRKKSQITASKLGQTTPKTTSPWPHQQVQPDCNFQVCLRISGYSSSGFASVFFQNGFNRTDDTVFWFCIFLIANSLWVRYSGNVDGFFSYFVS